MRAHIYLYLSIFLASIGGFLAATVVGWSSPMLERLKDLDDNPLGRKITDNEESWLASLSILGSCGGCIVIAIFGMNFGRKTLIVAHGCSLLIFYLIMAFSETIWLLYIGRLMTGEAVGGIFSLLPIYFGELATPQNRGFITTSMVVFMNAGLLFSTAAGPYFPFFWFHMSLATISALYAVSFYIFAPESPSYLIKFDRSKTEAVLRKIRGNLNFDKTLNEMEAFAHSDSRVSFMEIVSKKGAIKSIIIGFGSYTFMQLTGSSIIVSYTQKILKDAGVTLPAAEGPIIIYSIQFIVSLLFILVADRFPRKLLLAISHVGISLSQIVLAIYLGLKNNHYEAVENISWLPLGSLVVFFIMFNIGVAPVLMILLSELFPRKIKSVLVSCLNTYNLGGAFLLTLLFNELEDALGFDVMLWIFAGSGFVAVIFMKIFMIETSRKTLEEIQDELHNTIE